MANPSKACSGCGVNKPAEEFRKHSARCKTCRAEAAKRWRDTNPDRHRASQQVGKLRGRYRMTVEEYDVLLAGQQGRCAVCLRPPAVRLLGVDHDHATGLVRGLLCTFCNSKTIARHRGQAGVDLFNRAARYLANPPAQDLMRGHRVSDTKPNGKKWDDE